MAIRSLLPPDRRRIAYYCDESSQTDRFLAIAGLAVSVPAIPKIKADLAAINAAHGISFEVKWANSKRLGGKAHKVYIDYLKTLTSSNMAHFHIRFSEMQRYDHALSGCRKKIDTVSKSYYQLLLHRMLRFYGVGADIHIRPDGGDCTCEIHKYVDALHSEAYHKHGFCSEDCIRSVECRDSAKEPILQLLDVTLGALASRKNERHQAPTAHQVKTNLADYCLKAHNLRNLDGNTPLVNRRFSIWNVTPK